MPRLRALYREDLDDLPCSICGKKHTDDSQEVFLHPVCHPKAGVFLSYQGDVLIAKCSICGQVMNGLVVASKHSG